MNDRFKFRVYITAPITRDVEEEKEVGFYINDIGLYTDGGIGFSRDELLNALDKLNITEGQRNEIEDYISDNSYSEDWEWYAISFDRIEQCTGLKDKNGKLIYERDLIKEAANKYSLEVFYENGAWQTREYRENGKKEQLLYVLINCYGVEVIGNIHENPELLEVQDE